MNQMKIKSFELWKRPPNLASNPFACPCKRQGIKSFKCMWNKYKKKYHDTPCQTLF